MIERSVISITVALSLASCATFSESTSDSSAADHVTLAGQPAERLADTAMPVSGSEADFTPSQRALLAEAIAQANRITSDTAFLTILREMEVSGEIEWGRKRRRLLPRAARRAPIAWLLNRFEAEGNYGSDDIGVSEVSYPPTTAVTTACIPFSPSCALITEISPSYVTATTTMKNALANTLVHERVHSFGQQHGWSQARGPNMCDAAYVVGDLAESLLRSRDEGTSIVPRQALCGKLHRRLVARRIVAP
jgi:hypothetical protein